MVAWMIFSAWQHPQSRTTHLLQALLFLLLVALTWVSKRRRDSLTARLSKPGIRRTLASLMPLLVLALFGLAQVMEARQREADRQLAQKRESWRQAVERQRNIVAQAQERINDSLEKGAEASKALGKAWEQVRTADGKLELRAPRAVYQKEKEAWEEILRAMDLKRLEEERLFQLESQRPNR